MELTPKQEELLRKYPHYYKDVRHLAVLDVYRIIDLFNVLAGPQQHALKKVLLPGLRKKNTVRKDITEAIDTLSRQLEMLDEDLAADVAPLGGQDMADLLSHHITQANLAEGLQAEMSVAGNGPIDVNRGRVHPSHLREGVTYALKGCPHCIGYRGPSPLVTDYHEFTVLDGNDRHFSLHVNDIAGRVSVPGR